MSDQTPPPRKKNRETMLLLIVLGVGIVGLAALYFSRESSARAAERALLQAKSDAEARAADTQAAQQPIQKIPGDLLRVNTDAEAGTPYLFEMKNFAQGATYELDFGDGSGRKPLVSGKLRHTYRKSGEYWVRLYARYQGQEALIDSLLKEVGQPLEVPIITPGYDD